MDELLGVVYRHYPRGMARSDPLYEQTEEYRRLSEARRQAGAAQEPWRAKLRRLRQQFPTNEVQNLSLHLPTGAHDAAYAGQVFLPASPGEHFHTVGFLVGFLVPYYVVYSSRIVDDDERDEGFRVEMVHLVFDEDTCQVLPAEPGASDAEPAQRPRREIRRYELSSDEQPYAAWIARQIETNWGCERMPPEVGSVIVPDVATNLRSCGEATFYDCLLSDIW
jgi:hypothetical protein